MPAKHYDFIANLPGWEPSALQQEIERKFNLAAVTELRETTRCNFSEIQKFVRAEPHANKYPVAQIIMDRVIIATVNEALSFALPSSLNTISRFR